MNDEVSNELDFNQIMEEKVKFLNGHNHMALATSLNDLVTVRTVTYVSEAVDIYFLTAQHHTKCMQIKANPKVSVCIDNVQIQGKAEILGSPLDERNKEYADIYRKKLPDVFGPYSSIPGMVLVRITPILFETWVRTTARQYLEHLDLKNNRAYVFEELGKQ